jgi:DNA repair protein SbcC/Rad50
MLLSEISLTNVRSYSSGREVTLKIPQGVVLFEGDVGSGKSTLLYSLEFALFGFGEVKGSHILSEGKGSGSVRVRFSAGGTEYEVGRGLKRRGDDVLQTDCYIESGGVREPLSASDLKERVISILKFNEPTHPRAQSLVYRYAVFTPQEQMKDILLRKGEDRLHVIRRILGAQSYAVAAENADSVGGRISRVAYGLEKASEDLEMKGEELGETLARISSIDGELPELRRAQAAAAERVRALEEKWAALRESRDAMNAVAGSIPMLREGVRRQEAQIQGWRVEAARANERLSSLGSEMASFGARPAPPRSSGAAAAALAEVRSRLGDLREARAVAERRLRDGDELLSKGVCPRCGQPLPKDLAVLADHSRKELVAMKSELGALSERLDLLEVEERDARDYEEAMRAHERMSLEAISAAESSAGAARRIAEAEQELRAQMQALETAKSQEAALKGVSVEISEVERSLASARKVLDDASNSLMRASTRREEALAVSAKLRAEVDSKREMRAEKAKLEHYRDWVSDFFRPAVEAIERQTMVQANSRFNHHFQRFFAALVGDDELTVRTREDFSPVFERQGFEQDYDSLSGGERTSIALAYRFALNAVVREDLAGRTELMILDEPTDGFSREQVFRMRDLLRELNSSQVILVSHERELEPMADHVFRVHKSNGTSKVTDASG